MLRGSGINSQWQFSLRFVDAPRDKERPRWRTTLSYRLTQTLQAGFEFNATVGEFNPIANWYALRESDSRPALIFGTSSDRIGSPKGKQAYFLTVAKQLGRLPVASYFSINYSEWDRGINIPFGATLQLNRNWSMMEMYDGHAAHTLLTWSGRRESIQLIAVWNQRFGISFGYRF